MSDAARELILNVDDTESTRYVVTKTLEQADFRIREAATGQEALEAAQEIDPALVVLDIQLPDIDGFEVCRRLKSDPETAAIPVLQLSSTFVTEEDRARGLDYGADAYLTHPVEPIVLVATVNALLRMRRAEDGLRASAREWSATFDAIGDAVVLSDDQGRIARCNRAFADLVGLPMDELAGKRWDQVFEASLGVIEPPLAERHAERNAHESFELKAGSRWFRLTRDPFISPEGALTGAVMIIADITDRKRDDLAIRSNQAHIVELNHHLQRAMTETHHRVKNNLQIIAGMLDLQINDEEDPVSVDQVRRLGACVRTLAVVHDILTYEAKEDGQAHFIGTSSLLEKLMPMIQATEPRRPIRWEVDDVRLTARQGTSLALIVNELVNNALKQGEGTVTVKLVDASGRAILKVADEGPGFPSGFTPDASANTGIELVCLLSRWDLGGAAEFINRPNGGAEVGVTIPLTQN